MAIAESDLLKLAVERAGAIMVYWNALVVVSLGLLGFFASAKEYASNPRLKIIASVAFLIFAASNYDAIRQLNTQREELCALIRSDELAKLVAQLRPDQPWAYAVFHGVMDVAVVFALWFVGGRPSSAAAAPAAAKP